MWTHDFGHFRKKVEKNFLKIDFSGPIWACSAFGKGSTPQNFFRPGNGRSRCLTGNSILTPGTYLKSGRKTRFSRFCSKLTKFSIFENRKKKFRKSKKKIFEKKISKKKFSKKKIF